jgi:hypothetical protein
VRRAEADFASDSRAESLNRSVTSFSPGRNSLPVDIVERFEPEEGTIGNGHGQEKCRIIVDKLLVFFAG